MAKNGQAVKSSGGEAAAGKGTSGESASLLADGVALIESMLPDEMRSQVEGADSDAADAAQDETAEAGTTGEGAEAAEGSESESSSQECQEGSTEDTEENAESTEGEAAEGEDAAPEGADLTPGQQAINKRFAELTAKRKQAEEERDGFRAQLDEAQARLNAYESDSGANAPKPQGWVSPVDRIPQVREAREATSKATATRELAERLLAGEPEAALAAVREAGVKAADADAAVAYLKSVQASAAKAEARMEARLAAVEFQGSQIIEGERQQIGAQARKAYPWLLNRASQERKMFDAVAKELAYAKGDPAFELFVADAVMGSIARQKAVLAAQGAAGKGAGAGGSGPRGAAVPPVKPKVIPGRPGKGSGAGTVGRGTDGDSIRDQAMKDPTNEAARLRYLGRMAGG